MFLLEKIKILLGFKKPFFMSNPYIPWDIFEDQYPDPFNFKQKEPEFWVRVIWTPYWANLSNEERLVIKQQAPSQEWIDWIDLQEKRILYMREYCYAFGLNHVSRYNFIKRYTKQQRKTI